MNIAAFSIKRPTFIGALVVVMLVVGAVSFYRLKVDRFPNVNFPIIFVMTTYSGAAPPEIESQVTKPLEEQMASISGLKHLSSVNYEGMSIVIAEFSMGGDIKDLEQQARAKIAMAKTMMPDGVDEPIIRRMDPASSPILIATVSADMSPRDLYAFVDRTIKPTIAQVEGVANIDIRGGSRREIKVLLDRQMLIDHQVSVSQVSGKLGGSAMNIPVGKVTRGEQDLSFRTVGEYNTLEQVRKVAVNFVGSDVPVTVADLGEVVDGVQDADGYASYNGQPAIFLMIYRQSDTNTVKVADDTMAAINRLNKDLAKEASKPHINIVVDLAREIRMNISDVRTTIIEGILLAVIVVYLFLGSARSTFITTVALPNSLLGSFILMLIMGFTINIITLMALSLAIGLLIDDAIVVRENIWRHMDLGESPKEAAIKGTREVTLAVVATTMTVISVFLPIGFLSGMMGQFFKELGLTIVFAMSISLFDAMTTAPLLSAYLAKKDNGRGNGKRGIGNGRKAAGWFGNVWNGLCWLPQRATAATQVLENWLAEAYEVVIRWSIAHRPAVLTLAVLTLIGSFALFKSVKMEFMPPSDTGSYMVTLEMLPGTSLEATLKKGTEVQKELLAHKENRNISMMVGGASMMGGGANKATFFVEMSPYATRDITVTQMKQIIRDEFAGRKGMIIKTQDMGMIGGATAAFNMAVQGDDLNVLVKVVEQVRKGFAEIPDLVDLDVDYRTGAPEMQFRLEPDKLRALGASTIAVGTELRYMVAGNVPARFRDGDDEYDIRVFLRQDQRDLSAAYDQILVPNNNFNLVRLSDVATAVNTLGLTKITRRDRTRYINVMGNIGPNGTIGSVQGAAEKVMRGMDLPKGVTYRFWGTSEYFAEMVRDMVIAMILAVIFMYLILASLYESVTMPFLIMLSLVFSFVGAFIALKVTGQNLTMFAMIGLVMLLGLVAKNAILLVDFAIQQTRKGVNRDEAIVRAGRIRLRPILMTTVALLAGMLPLAFALTEVGKFRQSMGITVIGGLISSLALTLIVIPSMFGWVDRFRLWTRRLLGRPLEREIDLEEKEEYRKQKAEAPERRNANLK